MPVGFIVRQLAGSLHFFDIAHTPLTDEHMPAVFVL